MASSKRIPAAVILLTSLAPSALYAADRPKVRAITGFITIDAKSYASQIEDAVKFLSHVRDVIKSAGYEVAGIRIPTQPVPEYTRRASHNEAQKILRGIDDLSAKLRFAPNIGPAMLKDSDSTEAVDLLTELLAA